jgi:hypothetical protein
MKAFQLTIERLFCLPSEAGKPDRLKEAIGS